MTQRIMGKYSKDLILDDLNCVEVRECPEQPDKVEFRAFLTLRRYNCSGDITNGQYYEKTYTAVGDSKKEAVLALADCIANRMKELVE